MATPTTACCPKWPLATVVYARSEGNTGPHFRDVILRNTMPPKRYKPRFSAQLRRKASTFYRTRKVPGYPIARKYGQFVATAAVIRSVLGISAKAARQIVRDANFTVKRKTDPRWYRTQFHKHWALRKRIRK